MPHATAQLALDSRSGRRISLALYKDGMTTLLALLGFLLEVHRTSANALQLILTQPTQSTFLRALGLLAFLLSLSTLPKTLSSPTTLPSPRAPFPPFHTAPAATDTTTAGQLSHDNSIDRLYVSGWLTRPALSSCRWRFLASSQKKEGLLENGCGLVEATSRRWSTLLPQLFHSSTILDLSQYLTNHPRPWTKRVSLHQNHHILVHVRNVARLRPNLCVRRQRPDTDNPRGRGRLPVLCILFIELPP
ncbi:hypothetical protein CDEST_09319 [Colletotrichum destructivum]|uniref:Uncharacterized protein n=1 Tax=Colletotrichum destructivum TaxID=34406 RepID=A0AAX4ILL4_9PEZI|nr:hypothetical protein CDEST_09319 [Colletotrichum destructivum]